MAHRRPLGWPRKRRAGLLMFIGWLLLGLAPAAHSAEAPSVYCFVVGVSNVSGAPLPQADELAEKFAAKIRLMFPRAIFKTLTSRSLEKPTWEALDKIIHETIPQLPRYSSIIFYFAGHGERDNRNPEYDGDLHLLLEGASIAEPHRKSLRVAELYDAVARTRMINGLFFFDCCYSGTIIDPKTRTGRLFGSGDANLENTRRFLFFTATSNRQQATLGTFTNRLLSTWETKSMGNACLTPDQLSEAVIAMYNQDTLGGLQIPSLMPDLRTDWCLSNLATPTTMLLVVPKHGFDGAPKLTVGAAGRTFKFAVAPHVAMWMVQKSDRLTVKVELYPDTATLVLNKDDFKRDIVVLETDGKSIVRITPDTKRVGLSPQQLGAMARYAEAEVGVVEHSAEFFSGTARLMAMAPHASVSDRRTALQFYERAAAATPGETGRLMAIVASGRDSELNQLAEIVGTADESQTGLIVDLSRFHSPAKSLPLWTKVYNEAKDRDLKNYAAANGLANALAAGDPSHELLFSAELARYLDTAKTAAAITTRNQLLNTRDAEALLSNPSLSSLALWKANIASGLNATPSPQIAPPPSTSIYADLTGVSRVEPRISATTVRVGVLHSLSGPMATSEISMRDVLLFAFDEINAKGGVLGRKIQPVVVDGASDWPRFAVKAKELLMDDRVAATFGCSTSASRKSVVPLFEKANGLLFYPVQYEGEEESKNVFYTAEVLSHQAMPLIDYHLRQGKKKFYLLGSDYEYPQATNLVLLEYLLSKGVPIGNIGGGFRKDELGKIISAGRFTPFGHSDYQQIIAEIKHFAASGDACVISTLNGDTNISFFKEYAASGLTAESCPVASLVLAEDEFRFLPTDKLVGQLVSATYFQSINTPANRRFVSDFQAWSRQSSIPGMVREGRVTSAQMVNSYVGVYLWKAAVEEAGSFDVDKIRAALQSGISFDGPGGKVATQANMHLTKNVFLGESKADGQFKILQAFNNVRGEPWLKGKFK